MIMKNEDFISFSGEIQNDPYDKSVLIFPIKDFHYYDKTIGDIDRLLSRLKGHVKFYGAWDPSLGTDTTKGGYSAIIVLAKDTVDGKLYIIVADIERRDLDQTIDKILYYDKKYPFEEFAVEANQFQKVVSDVLLKKARERGRYSPINEMKNLGNKIKRIQSLQLLTKDGTIQFNSKDTQLLEQMLYFPKGRHDDGPDSLKMATRIAMEDRKITVAIVGPKYRRPFSRDMGLY